jgi:hypothetical protein
MQARPPVPRAQMLRAWRARVAQAPAGAAGRGSSALVRPPPPRAPGAQLAPPPRPSNNPPTLNSRRARVVAASRGGRANEALAYAQPPPSPSPRQLEQQQGEVVGVPARKLGSSLSPPSLLPASSPSSPDGALLKVMPTAVENAADDARLGNPLERAQRMSTSWFGLIAELEGVLVDDTLDLHQRAWLEVAAQLGFPAPLGQQLRRIKGLRDELVSLVLLCVCFIFLGGCLWTRARARGFEANQPGRAAREEEGERDGDASSALRRQNGGPAAALAPPDE